MAIASGIQIIIFLSGLQTISTSMYEAADIEGCTKWESLWKITLPMVSSLFLVNWIYTIVDFCMRSDNEVIEKISEEITVHVMGVLRGGNRNHRHHVADHIKGGILL